MRVDMWNAVHGYVMHLVLSLPDPVLIAMILFTMVWGWICLLQRYHKAQKKESIKGARR